MRVLHVLVCLALVFLVAGCSGDDPVVPAGDPDAGLQLSQMQAVNENPGVIPPGAQAHGKSYGEWAVAWWQWLWSAPVSVNPGLDETGDSIDYGQSGPVWFIAPNYGGTSVRTATIPAGKALLIDVVAWFFAPQIGDPSTEPELRAAAAAAMDATQNITLEIDGRAVVNIDAFRVQSPELFSYTLPEDNMFALFGFPSSAGTYYPAVTDGIFVMLTPLPAGPHTIHMYAAFPDPFGTSDVTVHLNVSGAQERHVSMD